MPKNRRKWYIIVAVIVIIAVIVAAIYSTYFKPVTPFSASIAPSTLVAQQGTPIQFSVVNNNSNIKSVTWYLGDGTVINGSSSLSYAYSNSGKYLVYAVIYSVTGQSIFTYANLYQITVVPKINETLAPLISVPVITFNATANPNAPIVNVNETLYLYGGFLETPSGNNITISKYLWDFGNGQTKAVNANQSTFLPIENPVKVKYSNVM